MSNPKYVISGLTPRQIKLVQKLNEQKDLKSIIEYRDAKVSNLHYELNTLIHLIFITTQEEDLLPNYRTDFESVDDLLLDVKTRGEHT